MNNDAWASKTDFVSGSSLLLLLIFVGLDDRICNRCGQTPRRGDRLVGLATAAKKESTKKCVNQKSFAAKHGIRLANLLQDWQISIEFEGRNLLSVLIPLSALIAKEVFENMLP